MGFLSLHSGSADLIRCFSEVQLDDFVEIRGIAFRAVHLPDFMLFDGNRFAEFRATLAADVFVEGHMTRRFPGSGGSLCFARTSTLALLRRSPFLAK
jgi:hypothetical protein